MHPSQSQETWRDNPPAVKPFIFAGYYQHLVNWCRTNLIHPTQLTHVTSSRAFQGISVVEGIYILAGPCPYRGLWADENEITAMLELYRFRPAKESDLRVLRRNVPMR